MQLKKKHAILDDTPDLGDDVHFIHQPPMLAVEDGVEEGEPDDGLEENAGTSHKGMASASDSKSVFQWGPFVFTKRYDQRKKGLAATWICKCIFHHDEEDPIGTECKRSITFYSREQSESDAVVERLKCWALAGRMKTHRAAPKNDSHVAMKWVEVPLLDAETLENCMADALGEVAAGHTWIQTSHVPSRKRRRLQRKSADVGDGALPAEVAHSTAQRSAVAKGSARAQSRGGGARAQPDLAAACPKASAEQEARSSSSSESSTSGSSSQSSSSDSSDS